MRRGERGQEKRRKRGKAREKKERKKRRAWGKKNKQIKHNLNTAGFPRNKVFKLCLGIIYMEKKSVVITMAFFVFFMFFGLVSVFAFNESGEIYVGVEVVNSPPSFLSLIPNQSWAMNTNLTGAFLLDDYFSDAEGEVLNYSYSGVDNISLVIGEFGNVSFYSDFGFEGIRNITFYASDGVGNSSSNVVYLKVGLDKESPQWQNASKDKSDISQNDFVNFSAYWSDNEALSSFIFSIYQGSWVNYSDTFSGVNNISLRNFQISAPPSSMVSWFFCGYDTSDNMNCTDVENFSVSSSQTSTSNPSSSSYGDDDDDSESSTSMFDIFKTKETKRFELNVDSFKISLKQGHTETRILEIINTGNTELNFDLTVFGVTDFVKLSDSSFKLQPGEKKRVTIDFSAFSRAFPGQYFGELEVRTDSDHSSIPIVIDVNFLDLEFEVDVDIPDKYDRVRAGKIVFADIKILNVKDISSLNVTLYTALKDFYGNIYDSKQEVVFLTSSLDLVSNFTIPKDVKEGNYLFYARASSGEIVALDSDEFEVGVRVSFAAFLRSSFVFIMIFLFSVFTLVLISKYRQEKQKEKILSLYMTLTQLKEFVKQGRYDDAIDLYVRLKTNYGEIVSNDVLEDRERFKEEIKKLSSKINVDRKNVLQKTKGDEGAVTKDKNMIQDTKKDKKDLGKIRKKNIENKKAKIFSEDNDESKELKNIVEDVKKKQKQEGVKIKISKDKDGKVLEEKRKIIKKIEKKKVA